MTLLVPPPDAQIDFAAALAAIRGVYLQDALSATVKGLSVPDIDRDLAAYVPGHSLTTLAAHGLRGEMVFPVPTVLTANPRLLGYYRLLYGYSQKQFYDGATGLSQFKGMEEHGTIRSQIAAAVPELARALCAAGALLVAGIGTAKISAALLDDLTLLTLGPQFRGGANVGERVWRPMPIFDVTLQTSPVSLRRLWAWRRSRPGEQSRSTSGPETRYS